jgi:hypothetical protein
MQHPATKTVTLIDVENAHAEQRHNESSVKGLKRILEMMIQTGLGEVVIGTSYGPSLMPVQAAFRGEARYTYTNGRDGAELAILDHMQKHYPVGSIDHLIIVSGDYRFTELAQAHRAAGARVTVISLHRSCAETLRRLAHKVLWLPSPTSFSTALAN